MSTATTTRPDDVALAERDPDLTGLPLVLDDAALSDRLGTAVRVQRVRYKPGSSIVAAWRSVAGDDRGWVGAYRGGDKVGKALEAARRTGAWSSVLDPRRHVVATDATGDRALSRALRDVRRRHPELLDGARLLRHNPSRRQVWRCGDLVLRLGTEEVTGRHEVLTALAAHDVPVLVPRRLEGVRSAEVLPWWGRGDLATLPASDAATAAGAAVARLHAVAPDRAGQAPAASSSPPDRTWTSALLALEPAWAGRVTALHEELARRTTTARGRVVRLHGDLSADQVLVDGDRIALVDLDRTCLGSPEQDAGSFLAAAHLAGQHSLVAPFLAGHASAGGRLDPDLLAAWQAVSLAQRAVEPFRTRAPRWRSRCADVLTAAERVLR